MVDVDNRWQPTGKLTAQVYGPVCVSACLSVRHKSVLNSNNNASAISAVLLGTSPDRTEETV